MDRRLRTWRWRVFGATWLCYAGYYFCRKPFSIVKGELGRSLHFDATTLGDIGAAYLIAYAIGQFLAGAIGNRLGARWMLLGGMALSAVMNVGFGIATTTTVFFGLMICNGLAQATGWSGNVGTMAAWFHRRERGAVMGIWATNFQVGGILANGLAAWATGAYGYRWAFFLGALALGVVWVVVYANQRNRPEDVGLAPVEDPVEHGDAPADEGDGRWTRAVLVNLALVSVVYFFLKFIRYALWSWAPYFLAKNFGLTPERAGYLSTLFDVMGVPGVVITGWLSDRYFGSRRAGVCLLMVSLLTASCLVLYFGGRVSVPVFAICIGVMGFSLYGPDALLTGAGVMDIGSRRGALLAAALVSGVGSIGSVVQEVIIGRLYDARGGDLGPIFLLLVGSALAAVIALAVIAVRNKRGRSDV